MKITITDHQCSTTSTIEDTGAITANDAASMFYRCMVGQGFHPNAVIEAMLDVAEDEQYALAVSNHGSEPKRYTIEEAMGWDEPEFPSFGKDESE